MIKSTGVIFENDYLRHSRELDGVEPREMGKVAAVVLAVDVSRRPIERVLDAKTAEMTTAAGAAAFRKRFKCIDAKDPAPRPLQVYDGEPAVARTVRNVLAAGAGKVVVLAHESVFDEVAAALEGLGANGDGSGLHALACKPDPSPFALSVVRYDEEAACAVDAESDGTQIELLTRGQILQAAKAAGVTARKVAFDSLLVVHADQVDFEPRHFWKLRATFEESPEVDFVTSYVEWRHGTPVLLSRRFLNRFARPVAPAPRRVEGAAAMACRLYDSRTALMGEEKLFGPYPVPPQALKEGALPGSALATVQAARHAPTRDERQAALAKGIGPDKHAKAAKAFLAEVDASLGARPIEGLDWADAWARRNRVDFPLFGTRDNAGLVYLDAAATSIQPAGVIAACREFAEHYDANIWRGVYGNSVYSTGRYQGAREKVAAFIGADPRDCIFTTNTTTSMNIVADSWAAFNVGEGDLVCAMVNEHHTNLLPWVKVAEQVGAQVELIRIGLDGRVDWKHYEKLLARRPQLVAAAHVSNVIGLENPIRKMASAAHEAGAVFVLDAAQSAPHIAIDVRKLGVDFLAFSGHKMQGPTGVGVLWAHPDRIREMRPTQVGGGVISEVSLQGTYWRQHPYCFEPGTPPIEQAIGLGAAIDYLQALGMDDIERHVRVMSRYALRVAGLVGGIRVWGDHGRHDGALGLLSYSCEHVSGLQASIMLGRMGVATRAGAHCAVQLAQALGIPGTTRISFGPYTTKADIEAWGFAMKTIQDLCADDLPRV